ncbi:GNAT family N-acetyltransferase [Pseudonocardia sp. CNS-139]|nr:GNAT family N-acetyltransferase [Pseudonocardia sp. CNS-139]
MTDVEIRTFTEPDRAPLLAVFRRAGEGAPTADLWGHDESEADVYLTPYMDHEPDSLFLAVVGGEPAGYLAGSLGSGAPDPVPAEDARIAQAIRDHRLVLRRRPAAFFLRAGLDAAWAAVRREPTAGELDDPRWPAHLHINVVPQVRGTGAAAALMAAWQDRLRATGTPGCYLQTLVENVRAVRFFERSGFEKHGPTPVVPGLRHEGRPVHQQTMTWNTRRSARRRTRAVGSACGT